MNETEDRGPVLVVGGTGFLGSQVIWHTKLTEDCLEQLSVPFVALRPGAFLDQVSQIGGDQFAKRRLSSIGSPAVPATFVLTVTLPATSPTPSMHRRRTASGSTSAGTAR